MLKNMPDYAGTSIYLYTRNYDPRFQKRKNIMLTGTRLLGGRKYIKKLTKRRTYIANIDNI